VTAPAYRNAEGAMMRGTPVSDVMTHTVAAIGRGATFKDIVRMMHD
jgi:hypothetical protein